MESVYAPDSPERDVANWLLHGLGQVSELHPEWNVRNLPGVAQTVVDYWLQPVADVVDLQQYRLDKGK